MTPVKNSAASTPPHTSSAPNPLRTPEQIYLFRLQLSHKFSLTRQVPPQLLHRPYQLFPAAADCAGAVDPAWAKVPMSSVSSLDQLSSLEVCVDGSFGDVQVRSWNKLWVASVDSSEKLSAVSRERCDSVPSVGSWDSARPQELQKRAPGRRGAPQ